MSFREPNKYRVRSGLLSNDEPLGHNGAFFIPLRHGQKVMVIASDEGGWEHVIVSRRDRCPTWEEMCQVKDLFWEPEDCVVQFHPPRSEYVNVHPNCLHMWRPVGGEWPMPESWLVGAVV